MLSIQLCIVAFVITYACTKRSLVTGLAALFLFGYLYGILRANILQPASHFIFDAATLGLYVVEFRRRVSPAQRWQSAPLRAWLLVLMLWPIALTLLPVQDYLIQIVGLRGNVYFLPFMLIGTRLSDDEWTNLAMVFAVLNVLAFMMAAAEFVVGIEPFFPRSAVTYIMYASKDVAGYTAHRIPSTFTSAHAYGGTMVTTLPLLIGAVVDRQKKKMSRTIFLTVAIALTGLGVFLAAARTHAAVMFIVLLVANFSSRVRISTRVGGLILVAVLTLLVSSEERLQRFTTLEDTQLVSERVSGSVNSSFLDLVVKYPLGNGMGGGGTSVPYFLQDRIRNPIGLENEFSRVLAEQGLPGLALYIAFLGWLLVRRHRGDRRLGMGLRLSHVACGAYFLFSAIGTGVFTSIPQTCVMFLLSGWLAKRDLVRPRPAIAPFRPEPLDGAPLPGRSQPALAG